MLFVAACAPPEPEMTPPMELPQEAPPAPEPEPEIVPETENKATAVVTGADKTFGEVEKTTALDLDSVQCDPEKQSITFSFENNDDQGRSWQLNQQVGWGVTDMIAVHVL